jgi:DUF4097 and DUF4098 domain-containing protein YvlB
MSVSRFSFLLSSCVLVLGALVPGATAAGAQARRARAPATDQTIAVQKGQRLHIENFAGEVVVRAWDKDQVRVIAEHDSRAKVNIRSAGTEVHVSSSRSGAPALVDYTISVPAWLAVRVNGTYVFVSVEGTQSDVAVETVRGDVTLRGGSGVVSLKSVEGEILVDGARGRLALNTVNEGIRITGATGDISAETINGEIRMLAMKAASVEATTVNGDIVYEGTVGDALYRFSTHNGDISLAMPENVSAVVTVRTYQGDLRSSFPIAERAGELRRGRRQIFTLGGGAAQIEAESFGGDVRLRRIGEVQLDRRRNDDKHKPKHEGDFGLLETVNVPAQCGSGKS